MKKIIIRTASLGAIVSAAMAFNACTQLDEPQGNQKETTEAGNFTVNFECTLPDDDEATRTEFHDKTIWWSKGDEALFAQYAVVGGSPALKTTSNASLTSSKSVLSLTVSTFNEPDAGTDAAFFSVYPYASYKARTTSADVIYPRITLPSTQSPSADCFDSNADLLISQYEHNLSKGEDGKYSVKLRYKRMVAIAKMTVKNLPSESTITTIEFSALKSGKAVALAGSRLYDLVNGAPSSLTTSSCYSDAKISLDYSSQEISANSSTGMIAYFMCYPFELVSGDSFNVVVKTAAGETFTKEVTIPSGRTLGFNEGKGSVFSVDMATADKVCTWFTLGQSSSANTVNTIYSRVAKASTYSGSITSIDYVAVKASEYDPTADYFASGYKTMAETSVAMISNGTALSASIASLEIDTEYKILYKVTNSDGETAILKRDARTDWFKLGLATRSAGDLQSQFYGVGLDATKTKNYRIVATSALEGIDPETYYTSTLNPGTSSSLVSSINTKGATGLFYHESEYYVDKTNKATVTSGVNYTIMMKVVNTRGESKFVFASANAK